MNHQEALALLRGLRYHEPEDEETGTLVTIYALKPTPFAQEDGRNRSLLEEEIAAVLDENDERRFVVCSYYKEEPTDPREEIWWDSHPEDGQRVD